MTDEGDLKTYLIGDTHLCDGTGPSFKNHDKLSRFLDRVATNNLIILGDCLDLWRWGVEEIIDGPNRDIIDRLTAKPNVSVIIGNHDLDLDVMRSIFQHQIYMSLLHQGWFCIHGHQLDPRLDSPKERKLAREISLIIQRLDIGLLNRFRDLASSGPRSNAAYKKKFLGVRLAMGHTHVPEIRASYLNPGAWTGDTCHAIVLENGASPRMEVCE
jgi:predicted phosphodiesterase